MGKRGPKPRTALQHAAQGYISVPLGGTLAKPRGLGRIASAEWDRITHELQQAGRLCTVDANLIRNAAEAWEDIREIRAQLADQPRTLQNANGMLQMNPLIKDLRESVQMHRALLRDLLLTPAARVRGGGTMMPAEDPGDELAAFRMEKPNLRAVNE